MSFNQPEDDRADKEADKPEECDSPPKIPMIVTTGLSCVPAA